MNPYDLMSSVSGQIYGGQPTIYGAPYQPQYYVPFNQNQQYIPVNRNINPQSVIRPVGTDMTSGQRNVDLTKGTEYELNPGEVIENKGTKNARVIGEDAPRGGFGLPRAAAGLLDWVTNKSWIAPFTPNTDADRRGDGREFGNLPEEGLGRVPTVKPPEIPEINPQDPSYMPGYDPRTGLPDYNTQQDISAWRSRDAADLYRDRTSQRIGDFNTNVNEFQRMAPILRDQILTSRLMTEAFSPAELQKRMGLASKTALNEAMAMNQYQTAANDWVRATNTMPSRSFGQAVVANVPNISGRA